MLCFTVKASNDYLNTQSDGPLLQIQLTPVQLFLYYAPTTANDYGKKSILTIFSSRRSANTIYIYLLVIGITCNLHVTFMYSTFKFIHSKHKIRISERKGYSILC